MLIRNLLIIFFFPLNYKNTKYKIKLQNKITNNTLKNSFINNTKITVLFFPHYYNYCQIYFLNIYHLHIHIKIQIQIQVSFNHNILIKFFINKSFSGTIEKYMIRLFLFTSSLLFLFIM